MTATSMITLLMALLWLFVGVGCWVAFQLIRQNGRILMRLEALEKHVPQRQSDDAAQRAVELGLPAGSVAPDFELPDLSEGRRTLSEFRGRRVLLIFFSPRCGFCVNMAADIAALPIEGSDAGPIPILVTNGDADLNRRFATKHGIRCPVLLQQGTEVSSKYHANGTPMGYLIDERGDVAMEMAVGAQAVLALAVTPSTSNTKGGDTPEHKGKVNQGLGRSRLVRNGLKPGTVAPMFALPLVGGGELSLESFRGRRVLLVFSDPDCVPCDRLAPQLEQLQRQRSDLQVLMVGRGDAKRNRQKVKELGLTFPVVLQERWEISLLYGMFGTPIGYLVDEHGVIASNAAKGVEAILTLAESAVPSFDRQQADFTAREKAIAH